MDSSKARAAQRRILRHAVQRLLVASFKAFNDSLGYPDLLILASLAILIIADTSCYEQEFSRVNNTLTKQRNQMDLESLRDHLFT